MTSSMAGRGAGRATFRASARAGCRRRRRRARSCRSARTTSGASSALSPRARRARCESRDRQGEAVMPRLRVPRAAAMRMPRQPRAAFVIVTTACRRWRCLTAPSSRRLLCPPTCGIARRSRARASAAHRPRRRPRIRCCESAPYGSWPPWVVVVDDPCHVDSAHRSAELSLCEGAKPRVDETFAAWCFLAPRANISSA